MQPLPGPTQFAPLPEGWGRAAATSVPGLYAETSTAVVYSYALDKIMEDCSHYRSPVAFEFHRGDATYTGDSTSLQQDRRRIYITESASTVVKDSVTFDPERSDPQKCVVHANVKRSVTRYTHAGLRASPLLRNSLLHQGRRTTEEILGYPARCVDFGARANPGPGVVVALPVTSVVLPFKRRCISAAADRSRGLLLLDYSLELPDAYFVTALEPNVLIDTAMFDTAMFDSGP